MSKQNEERITGLLEEEPISFYPNAAVAFGVNEAIVLQQISFYMNVNQKKHSNRHFHNGRWWVYNTYKQWCEDHFPWLTERGLQGVILGLEKEGVLLSMQGVEDSRDRRKWYTIDRKKIAELVQNATQKRAMHSADYAPSHSAKNVSSMTQNMHDEIPERTTENTTERKERTFARTARADKSHLENPDGSIRWPDSDEVSVTRLEREEKSTRNDNSTKRAAKTKDSTPIPPTPLSTTPKQDNPLQSAVKALGQAYGVIPVEGDYGAYAGVASKLLKAGIVREEFAQYVEYWRSEAQRVGWKFTVTSLTGAGRMSEFVGWRDANARRIAALPPEIQRVLKPVPVEDRVDPTVIDAFFKDIGISREVWAATAEKGMQK